MKPNNHYLPLFATICLAFANANYAQPPSPPAGTPPAAPGGPAGPRTPPPAIPIRITPAVTLPFKEDFESGQINTNIWDLRATGAATIKVQQDKVAHGKNALQLHYPAGTSRSMAFIAAHLPDSLHDHLYGRMYMYLSSVPESHSPFFMAGTAGYPNANYLEVGSKGPIWQPSYQAQAPGGTRGETPAFEGDIPLKRWFCLEWEFNDKPDEIRLWVDGKKVTDQAFTFHDAKTDLVKGFAEFDMGFRTFTRPAQLTNDIDIYYDDLEISDKPIGQLTPVPQ